MSDPVVSVIMAAYNGAALLPETLAMLSGQSFGDFELIVVDDCSTDTTREVVAAWPDPRVRLIALDRNGGPVIARNRAMAEARGRYIAALDHDDLCRPERFARQIAYLDANPDIALAGTGVAFLSAGRIRPSTYPAVTTPALIAWLTRIENPIAWSSVMLRADIARRIDPFTRPELLYAEDFDLYHRIQSLGGIARLDDVLLVYRQHPGGVSKRFVDQMEASTTRVLCEAYADPFGDRAQSVAQLIVRHNMMRLPVPDRDTLATIAAALVRLQADFLARHDCDAQSLALIRRETMLRWRRIVATGLRAGTLTLGDALAVRSQVVALGADGVAAILRAWADGGARRLARQTLAAKIIRPGPSSAKT